jgi:hypothetical protein
MWIKQDQNYLVTSGQKTQPLYFCYTKATEDGYVFCDGLFYEMSAKLLFKTGAFAQSQGDGYCTHL